MRWINYYKPHHEKFIQLEKYWREKVLEDEGTVHLQKGLLIQEEGHSYTR